MTAPTREELSDRDTKLVYIKRWRTIVRLPTKYADEIVEALRAPAEPPVFEGDQREAIAQALWIRRGGRHGNFEANLAAMKRNPEKRLYQPFHDCLLDADAILALRPSPAIGGARGIEFDYTNWEGRKSLRRAQPISVRFGKSEWHPKPQWLMLAFDVGKNAEREFAMAEMEFEDNALAALSLSPETKR